MNCINLKQSLSEISEYFSPKIIEEVNDVFIKIAKIKGNKVPWHIHENEDELFLVLQGALLLEIENNPEIIMHIGDLFVVKKGTKHRVSSNDECHIMLIENKSTEHTGNVTSEITKSIQDQK